MPSEPGKSQGRELRGQGPHLTRTRTLPLCCQVALNWWREARWPGHHTVMGGKAELAANLRIVGPHECGHSGWPLGQEPQPWGVPTHVDAGAPVVILNVRTDKTLPTPISSSC